MTSTRALTRALGIGQLTPANVVKQSTGNNSLGYSDYVSFWNSVQRTQSGATKLLVELLNKFVEIDRSHARRLRSNAKEAAKDQGHVDRILWYIVNTVRFVDLFLGVDANNSNLRKAQRAYESHRMEFPATTPSARELDAFLRTVFRSIFESADTTNALVMELTFVNSVEWTLETGTRDLTFTILRDSPFVGLRLLAKVAMGGRESYAVFFEIAKQLSTMPSLIRAQPNLMNSTLGNVMSLLFFMRECLSYYPVLDHQILQRLADSVKAFQQWPLPYGAYARTLLEMINQEMKAPGSALRARIRGENPLLTDYGIHQAERFGSQGADWSSSHRIVTVLHNSNVARSHLLRRLIGRSLFKGKAWQTEMQQCREELLGSLIESSFIQQPEDNNGLHSAVVSALRNRNQADLINWYERAMRCTESLSGEVDTDELMNIVKDISPALAQTLRPRHDTEQEAAVVDEDEILAGLEAVKKEPFDPKVWNITVPRTPFLSFEFLEIYSASQRRAMTQEGGLLRGGPPIDDDDDFGSSSFFNKGRATGGKSRRAKTRASLTIPGLDTFSLNPAFEGEIDPYGIKGQHQVPQKYLAYPSDFEELVKDARLMLPPEEVLHPGSRASFTAMAHDSKAKRKDERMKKVAVTAAEVTKPVLRRVILGGHDVLHRALCTYVALQAVDPQLCSKIDFQFYLVPLGRNDLASFLAQRDGWYRKHVYVPFHAPLALVPQCKWDPSGSNGEEFFSTPEPARTPTHAGLSSNNAAPKPSRRTSLLPGRGVPSHFDSDIGGLDSERGPGGAYGDDDPILDSLEELGGFNALTSDMPVRRHRLEATPAKLLRPLLESYVRNARSVSPVVIYDCECWESPDAIEIERNPDVTIPFCIRVELGLGAAVAAHSSSLEFTTSFEGKSVTDGLGVEPTFEEILNDKTFIKAVSGNNADLKITTPELTVSMFTMGVDGTLDDRFVLELADTQYLSLVVSSVPRFTFPSEEVGNVVRLESTEPPATAANPCFPWLEVQSVGGKSSAVDLIKKKDKKPKDMDAIAEALKYESKTHHIGFLDIRSTLTSRVPFSIAVDGQSFGPYYRVRIRRSTALSTSGGQAIMANSPQLTLPVMTFFPATST